MSSWLIIVTGLIYAYIAAEQAYKGNMGMAICYAGYALGNVGLYIMAKWVLLYTQKMAWELLNGLEI